MVNPNSISLMDAIYNRRSVRDYLPQKVSKDLINILLDAAVQAPSALHEEPCAFAIIQNKSLLDRLSECAKKMLHDESLQRKSEKRKHILDVVEQPEFHVFYNATTLVVICSKFQDSFVEADCWLAAENLMLSAYAHGLGSRVIGFSAPALNLPEWKAEIGIPDEMNAVVPIILGTPSDPPLSSGRKSPEIIAWK
ncbi:nitroreductase family protein [Legionella maceachernii]|uniref:Nitroreductase n=1 Tax=Legionella maceachernii TaxID=466 RepID=A0A0W0WGF1_9GAMM|nr:nitroreductase family protein [Legionella maceachernii]KTD31418.1 nitroreductase [Legionella maceachernii]SKA23167.1 Nitroreductase [Legionella maceachernii]SUO98687.1 Putative NAD(P)H nitroreductase SAV2523 [Legionella maceachernii]